jgi:hypothetical protein
MTANFTKRPYRYYTLLSYLNHAKYTYKIYIHIFHYKTLQNIPKSGIIGLKINHLATLFLTKVTRLGDFSPVGRFVYLCRFFEKLQRLPKIFGKLFSTVKVQIRKYSTSRISLSGIEIQDLKGRRQP